MTANPEIDVRDLKSVREAASKMPDVVLGDDWVAPQPLGGHELGERRRRRGFLSLRRSPIARKIITFNLFAMMLVIAGVLYFNSTRDTLVAQRTDTLVSEARLVANVVEATLPATAPVNLITGDGIDVVEILNALDLPPGMTVQVFDMQGNAIAERSSDPSDATSSDLGSTFLADALENISTWATRIIRLGGSSQVPAIDVHDEVTRLAVASIDSGTQLHRVNGPNGQSLIVTTPVLQGSSAVGALAIEGVEGEISALVKRDREMVLRLFLVCLLISIVLSLLLASTIANPLADLAAAAELGRDKNARKMSPTRVRIPDLSGRPDEIGRLSGALRGMVSALYERIEGNEQFAADVAHEIKNPLASLRSAVGTLRVAKRDDQREKLLEVIEHDVRRLDRLVSDISNASRLDSELVKEEEETFDLLKMLDNINDFLGREAEEKGIEYIEDMPDGAINVQGLEGRLAQVFVNLITNAVSFCEDGDAIRVWARRRENRVLIVVEDTGPGIPNEALTKIFKRFYSERPAGQFGNNSGLGLAISKQIVEAHGGVIWAENIRPTDADMTSEPLGARFVVGLPV